MDIINPAVAKEYAETAFPVMRDIEDDTDWIPHLKFPFFQYLQCGGWWIYRIRLHRFGTQDTISVPQVGEIPVTLGCIRNGVFVAFGTWNTGTVIDLPDRASFGGMWPIFTATELCYQASERVDVQASIVNFPQGANGFLQPEITMGPIGYPIAAAFHQDTEAVLLAL